MRGLQRHVKIIPTLQGVPVHRHFFCNLVIARDLQVRQQRKPPAPHFAAFADYREYLKSRLERITLNANDRSRFAGVRLSGMRRIGEGMRVRASDDRQRFILGQSDR